MDVIETEKWRHNGKEYARNKIPPFYTWDLKTQEYMGVWNPQRKQFDLSVQDPYNKSKLKKFQRELSGSQIKWNALVKQVREKILIFKGLDKLPQKDVLIVAGMLKDADNFEPNGKEVIDAYNMYKDEYPTLSENSPLIARGTGAVAAQKLKIKVNRFPNDKREYSKGQKEWTNFIKHVAETVQGTLGEDKKKFSYKNAMLVASALKKDRKMNADDATIISYYNIFSTDDKEKPLETAASQPSQDVYVPKRPQPYYMHPKISASQASVSQASVSQASVTKNLLPQTAIKSSPNEYLAEQNILNKKALWTINLGDIIINKDEVNTFTRPSNGINSIPLEKLEIPVLRSIEATMALNDSSFPLWITDDQLKEAFSTAMKGYKLSNDNYIVTIRPYTGWTQPNFRYSILSFTQITNNLFANNSRNTLRNNLKKATNSKLTANNLMGGKRTRKNRKNKKHLPLYDGKCTYI